MNGDGKPRPVRSDDRDGRETVDQTARAEIALIAQSLRQHAELCDKRMRFIERALARIEGRQFKALALAVALLVSLVIGLVGYIWATERL